MDLSNFLLNLKQKLTTSQKSSLFFVIILVLILPLSITAIYIPIRFQKRATEPLTPPVSPPLICALKSQGDANCDTKIDIKDFFIWRKEFLRTLSGQQPPTEDWSADFNNDNQVNIRDFFIWRRGFLAK